MKKIYLLLLSVFISYTLFYNFEYEVNEINSKVRTFLVHGKFTVRNFDEKGIPHSFNARQGKFVSPYYVAHYGLNYSDSIKDEVDNKARKVLWWDDPTADFWNVKAPITLIAEVNFKHSLDWIVGNVTEINGITHLPYTFEWKYKHLSINKLKPIWWSGLTDSLAMNLLLRGYAYYGEDRYLKLAKKLYTSLITDIRNQGSLDLDRMFVIEYASSEIPYGKYAYVLNGGYYAYKNIKAYEEYFKIEKPILNQLRQSLIQNLSSYFDDGWSYYDSIGNLANIKYNNINYSLALDLLRSCKTKSCEVTASRLENNRTRLPFFLKSIFMGNFEIIVLHLFLDFIALIVLCYVVLYLIWVRIRVWS